MSVDVWVVDAGERVVPCSTCAITAPDPCWPGCDGTERQSLAPTANWSNANAARVFAALGLDPEYGEVKPERVSDVLRRANMAVNNGTADCLATPGSDSQATRVEHNGNLASLVQGPRVIVCAQPADSFQRRLVRLQEILSYAAQHGLGISWG